MTLPATLRLGPVHLTVSDVGGSIAFYERALGLQLLARTGATAVLGAGGRPLVVLSGEPGAGLGGRHAGLYHYALLYPSRTDLAHALERLAATRTRIENAVDHGVSEAIYLRDPDDNGIELYADRPRGAWPAPRAPGDRVEMYTVKLDLRGLRDAARDEPPPGAAPAAPTMGHVHLHVGDVERGLAFYRDLLGFEVMLRLDGAAFVAAGGYHHHLAFNVWLGTDVRPLPPRTAGLRAWSVVLARDAEVAAVRERCAAADVAWEPIGDHALVVRDPWEIAVVVGTSAAPGP